MPRLRPPRNSECASNPSSEACCQTSEQVNSTSVQLSTRGNDLWDRAAHPRRSNHPRWPSTKDCSASTHERPFRGIRGLSLQTMLHKDNNCTRDTAARFNRYPPAHRNSWVHKGAARHPSRPTQACSSYNRTNSRRTESGNRLGTLRRRLSLSTTLPPLSKRAARRGQRLAV